MTTRPHILILAGAKESLHHVGWQSRTPKIERPPGLTPRTSRFVRSLPLGRAALRRKRQKPPPRAIFSFRPPTS